MTRLSIKASATQLCDSRALMYACRVGCESSSTAEAMSHCGVMVLPGAVVTHVTSALTQGMPRLRPT
jgi:hypothetical protein